MDAVVSVRRRALLQAGGAAALLAACGDPAGSRADAGTHVLQGLAMGSTYAAKIVAPGARESRLALARDALAGALADVVAKMSTHDPASELRRFNAHASSAPFAVSADTLRVFRIAREVSEASRGAFDVTVARAVDAWGFGPDRHRRVPPAALQRAALEAIDFRALAIDAHAGTIAKAHPRAGVDFSGVAKGYGVDRAARALDEAGFDRYLIEVGGEVRTRGAAAGGRAWRIGVERPDVMPRRAHVVVPLADASMATSGDYRIWFEQDGHRYCHEIDPTTGAPTTHALASVSVVAADCAHADAWATALYVLGPQRGFELAAQRGLAAHFIVRDGGRFVDRSTPAFAALGATPA